MVRELHDSEKMSESDTILWSNDEYFIRPAKNNNEFRDMWWTFMRELGWNRGYHDLDTYMNYSLGHGMILLIKRASNKPVGHVAAVINENETGWVAMFIIAAEHRGKGLGRPLFQAAMQDFERKRTKVVGLDGVIVQRGTYERRNFVASPLGEIKIMMRPLLEGIQAAGPGKSDDGVMMDLRKIPHALLARHELKYTGFYRPKLWTDELLFNRPDVRGIAYTSHEDVREVEDLLAWTLLRRCSSGVRIGPVYARDATSAESVLQAAMQAATMQFIQSTPLPNEAMNSSLDTEIAAKATLVAEVSSANPVAVKLFEELGWKHAGVEYVRMWVDGKAMPEQSKDGAAQEGVWAIFDAAVG